MCARAESDATQSSTRRDVVDRFKPRERAVLLQSTAVKQARSPIAFGGPSCRLLEAEAEQLGLTSAHPFETKGLIGAQGARA